MNGSSRLTSELSGILHPPPCAKKLPVVRQSTFSISEEFLRRTYFIKQRFPARFIVVIDRKALQKTISLWSFIAQVYDEVWISDNHSKVLLVDFSDGAVASMITSQNLTRGNRAESSFISSDENIYFTLLANFEDLRKNNSAPMHEIMPVNKDNPSGSPQSVISEIERLAGYFVTISDIATVLELDPMWLRERIADTQSPEAMAYLRGKAKARIMIKAQEMELAKVGSPLGMQSVRENLITMEQDEE